MSGFVTIIDSKTVEVRHKMSDYVRSLPTTAQWKLFIELTRPSHAAVIGRLILYTCIGCGGKFTGAPNAYRSRMKDNEPYMLRIGTKVRVEAELSSTMLDGVNFIERGHVVRPVTHRGLGCPTCLSLFHGEESKTRGFNKSMEGVDTIHATVARLSGCAGCDKHHTQCTCVDRQGKKAFKQHTFKSATARTPFIMLFEDASCEECKGTYHKWSSEAWNKETKEKGTYVVCPCYVPPIDLMKFAGTGGVR